MQVQYSISNEYPYPFPYFVEILQGERKGIRGKILELGLLGDNQILIRC